MIDDGTIHQFQQWNCFQHNICKLVPLLEIHQNIHKRRANLDIVYVWVNLCFGSNFDCAIVANNDVIAEDLRQSNSIVVLALVLQADGNNERNGPGEVFGICLAKRASLCWTRHTRTNYTVLLMKATLWQSCHVRPLYLLSTHHQWWHILRSEVCSVQQCVFIWLQWSCLFLSIQFGRKLRMENYSSKLALVRLQ